MSTTGCPMVVNLDENHVGQQCEKSHNKNTILLFSFRGEDDIMALDFVYLKESK